MLKKALMVGLTLCLLMGAACSQTKEELISESEASSSQTASSSSDSKLLSSASSLESSKTTSSSTSEAQTSGSETPPLPQNDNPGSASSDNSEQNDNPGAAAKTPQLSDYKNIDSPRDNKFSLQATFNMGGVTEASEIASISISGIGGSVDISDSDTIKNVWDMMGQTQLINDGVLSNPDTGGGMMFTFYFHDGTMATVSMFGFIELNGVGHYNYTGENAQQPYLDLFSSLS